MCIRDRGGLHQRSGVALPTGGRADPAVGNEALAGNRRSVFFSLVPGARWYPTLKPKHFYHTKTKKHTYVRTKTKIIRHVHAAHGQTRRFFLWGVSIGNSLRSNKIFKGASPAAEQGPPSKQVPQETNNNCKKQITLPRTPYKYPD